MSGNLKPFRVLVTLLAAALALTLLAGCGDEDKAGTETASSEPTITDPWARTTAEGAKTGAIYMTIKGASADDRLVSASVSDELAGKVEIHEVVPAGDDTAGEMESGKMESEEMTMGEMVMREVDGIAVPAGATVMLRPGGFHVMLLELQKAIAPGDEVEVTLTFEKAGELKATAVAREATM